MKCPRDGTPLKTVDRLGIQIDRCPECQGVWLDRGELDKIIERTLPAVELAEPPRATPPREDRQPYRPGKSGPWSEPYRDEEVPQWREPYRKDDRRSKKRRRKSLLDEIFDFD